MHIIALTRRFRTGAERDSRSQTLTRETAVKSHALSRSIAAALTLFATPAFAIEFGPLEIVGFAKDEVSFCDNCSLGVVNPSPFDPRGVLESINPMLNQARESGSRSSNLGLAQLTVSVDYEFDNAIEVEARASGRVRNNGPDIFDNYLIEGYAGISYPKFGSLQIGKMATRSWTRSDSFAYPIGLSSPWAESGASYGLIPEAVRYATPEYEIPIGKIRFEGTYGRAKKRFPLNVIDPTAVALVPPPSPTIFELFIQYSNEKNLIEAIYQESRGGVQSSFAKGAFFGTIGNTNTAATSPGYRPPSQNVLIVQGTYWRNDRWKFNYGVKRSDWSGQQQQCDFGPNSPTTSACFWSQAGFNYAADFKLYRAVEYDLMAGASYNWRQPYVFTAGLVQMTRARTNNTTEWGQSNSATFLNLGVYRKVPEISKYLEVYAGLGGVLFARQGPAPLGMPNNTAFGGVDPRISESSVSLTIGANFIF
jgi:hypothetical protein